MNIAFVGCGYVASYYHATLANHPDLKLIGVYDQDQSRLKNFSQFYKTASYPNLDALLSDERVEIVVNLTNPRNHYSVSKATLLAGKHLYSEKPLGMTFEEASELVGLAAQKGLRLGTAPCSYLSETAQTVAKALAENQIGKIRLVYAEMDDGMVHRMPYRKWHSETGIPWPYRDEFEVGCTLEHAAYYLTWLTGFFGPATSVTAFSKCLIPEKIPVSEEPLSPPDTPDFSTGIIEFESGIVARLTCGIIAPHDHGLQIIGDNGVLRVEDCWTYNAPVHIQRMISIRRKSFLNPWKQRFPLIDTGYRFDATTSGAQRMDFCRGIAALAEAIEFGIPGAMPEDFSLHNTEIALAIHNAQNNGGKINLKTTFQPLIHTNRCERIGSII